MSTVLLVDDTAVLQEMIGEILSDLGYTVLFAASGEEAVQVAADHEGPIDVLLTDILMPGMGGSELAVLISAKRTETRVLFMSGSGQEAMDDPGIVAAGGVILEKPFTTEELAEALRVVLGR